MNAGRVAAVLLILGAAIPVVRAGDPADAVPNLVVLYMDDMNMDIDLPAVHTPNIDALASRGVRFNRAYASQALCAPSRAALLSGQRTNHVDVFDNDDVPPPLAVNTVTYLPDKLRSAGYYCDGVGKIFHANQPACWDEYYDFPDDAWISKPALPHTPDAKGMVIGGPFLNGPAGELGKMADSKKTDKAIELLGQARQRLDATGQPFALWIGWEATHDPLIYPEAYLSHYTESDVPPLPAEETTVPWKTGVSKAAYNTEWFYDPSWAPTAEGCRVQAMLAHFRCIDYIDDEVGRILGVLDDLGLSQDTIVVLVSDHGWSFSEHSHVGKSTGFDEDVVAPLIVAVPALAATHGQIVSTPVSQVDLYPTLMELLGLQENGPLDGTSLVPQLEDVEAPHPPVFFTSAHEAGFNLTRHVVKRDEATGEVWKLSAWEHDDSTPQVHQLYELGSDPGEYFNRYKDPQLAAKVAELRADLASVGLLGPSTHHFFHGIAGETGVPALDWIGVPALGAEGLLQIGSSSSETTTGFLAIGFSGTFGVPKGVAIKPLILDPIVIDPQGLGLPALLPDQSDFDELPIGVQMLMLDPLAPHGFSMSRGLTVFLSH